MSDTNDFRINHDRFGEGYDAGKEAGHDEAFQEGFAAGRQVGVAEGREIALRAPGNVYFTAGYRTGVADTQRLPQATFQEGWDEGYEAGYRAGVTESDDE